MNKTLQKSVPGLLAAGATLQIAITLKIGGVPVNITGYTFVANITDNLDPTVPPIISKTVTSHTDPVNGKTLIEFTATETQPVGQGKKFIPIWYINGTNKVCPAIMVVNYSFAGEFQ